MKISHTLSLLFCRFTWWLRWTEQAKIYAEKVSTYKTLRDSLKVLEENRLELLVKKEKTDKIDSYIEFLKTLINGNEPTR